MEEFLYELKIPKERIAVLIGKKGITKKELQRETNTKIVVNSKEGVVKVYGKDPLMLYSLREVIKAIARGFNPSIAKLLLRSDYSFEIINIRDYAKSRNDEIRLRGRVIGENGRSRKNIERLTECFISVYGKTIGIIGDIDHLPLARRAIIGLLQGKKHEKVYGSLEKRRKELRLRERYGFNFSEEKEFDTLNGEDLDNLND